MPIQFGTDGLRGKADEELTEAIARALGVAAASVLGGETFYLGRDTRASSPRLSTAFAQGILSAGVHCIDIGIAPTPCVAAVCAQYQAPGAVISASHNPWFDNGIKILGPGGVKLPAEVEAAIETQLKLCLAADVAIGGDAQVDERLTEIWSAHLDGVIEGDLSELTIAIDTAHGAASALAPDIFTGLGATVFVMGNQPDGRNINDGVGSTHPEALAQLVVESGASLGLAFDGDADRLIAIDEMGCVVDGDIMITLFAEDLENRGLLAHHRVVVTVMSNLGMLRHLEHHGIETSVVPVGDRNVVAELTRGGYSLGGEQSGHIVFSDLATTGDGVLTGVLLADLVRRSGRTLSELVAQCFDPYPQVLLAVPGSKDRLEEAHVLEAIVAAEADLGDEGRIVVRASGTEAVIRILVEAHDAARANSVAQALAGVIG